MFTPGFCVASARDSLVTGGAADAYDFLLVHDLIELDRHRVRSNLVLHHTHHRIHSTLDSIRLPQLGSRIHSLQTLAVRFYVLGANDHVCLYELIDLIYVLY